MIYTIYKKIDDNTFEELQIKMVPLLVYTGLAKSNSEAKRLLINGEIKKTPHKDGIIFSHGKRNRFLLKFGDVDTLYEDQIQ